MSVVNLMGLNWLAVARIWAEAEGDAQNEEKVRSKHGINYQS